MIILVGGEKGGSGKSCLAQNLAVYLQMRGKDVLLVDCDPQHTTADWAKEREQNEAVQALPCVIANGNIRETITDLKKRYANIVIDCGGHDSVALRSGMTVATHLLLPFRPKRRDLKTLESVAELLELALAMNPALKANAVITQCAAMPSQFPRIADAKASCVSFGITPLDAITMNRNVYDDSDEDGSSVLENGNDAKAVAELMAMANEFLEV